MTITENNGRSILSFEAKGVIRRIPIEKRGTSKRGTDWTLGGVLLEVENENQEGSASLYLKAWGDELVEEINLLGVGKRVKVVFHIETKERYDMFSTDVVLDSVSLLTERK